MSTPCFVANWKMHKGIAETGSYLQRLDQHATEGIPTLSPKSNLAEMILAPPFTALFFVSEFLKRASLRVDLAAQNVHYGGEGAFTGEISASMLREVGCRYVIIGHSERRQIFGESDSEVHEKLREIIKSGLLPILCVGETLEEKKKGETWAVLKRQLNAALAGILQDHEIPEGFSEWIIAYEPVWAIGTGHTPTPGDIAAVHQKIREYLPGGKRGRPRVLYGGSVNEDNVEDFMKEEQIDGVLVGGASLSADKFLKIIDRGVSAKVG